MEQLDSITEGFSALKPMYHFIIQTENMHEALKSVDKLEDFSQLCDKNKTNIMKITNLLKE